MRLKPFLTLLFVLVTSCAYAASEELYIQVRFKDTVDINGQQLTYQDALYYEIDKFPSVEEREATEKERVENWKQIILNPPEPVEPSEAELIAQQTAIDEQIASLTAQKAECVAKVSAIQAAKIEPIELPIEKELVK